MNTVLSSDCGCMVLCNTILPWKHVIFTYLTQVTSLCSKLRLLKDGGDGYGSLREFSIMLEDFFVFAC